MRGTPLEGVAERELQISSVQSQPTNDGNTSPVSPETITDLMSLPLRPTNDEGIAAEQQKDPDLKMILDFLEHDKLLAEVQVARRLILQKGAFAIDNGILYYLDHRQGHQKRVAVPKQLREQILAEHHSSRTGGHFTVKKTYGP